MWAVNVQGSQDYGPKLEYDPQSKGSLQIEREKTDVGFLIAFIVYFFIWIDVGIYAFCTGDMKSMYKDFHLHYFSSISSDIMCIALGFTFLGICLGLKFLILFRYFPRTVFFITLFLNLALIIFFLCEFAYRILQQIEDKEMRLKITLFAALLASILFVLPTIVCVILFHRKIFIACEVVKESTKALLFFPSSFLFPILPFILYTLTITFTLCTWACLFENSSTQDGYRPFYLYVLHGINFLGFWWMMHIIRAFSQMVLAGTFATWYWTVDKNQIPNHVIFKFIYIATRFHHGTLAFGSLIITMVETLKYLLKSGAQCSASQSDAASTVLFSFFPRLCGMSQDVLEYINTNAYLMCIMHGVPFIQSGKDAFYPLKRNIMKVLAITCITSTVLAIAAFAMILLSQLATFAYCRNMEITVIVTAVLIVSVTTCLTSTAIFTTLETAINTIFLCVMEDDERNNGSREQPYHMPLELLQLLMRDAHGRYFDV